VDLSSSRWSRIEDLFHRAVDLEPASRPAFLNRECGADTELLREVESLLAADLNRGLVRAAMAQALERLPANSDEPSEQIGKRFGHYTITGLIGKGGMGVVYYAVREEDFPMQVAIKLIKRGTDTETTLSRFRREREILAGLQHPNIARLLDGGTSDNGLPYFVMEYVEGRPLLEYAAQFPIRERLPLFRAVCSAVQYAHQKSIVHRDIKPANILVTSDGTPKLLDFGIAKLLDPAVDGATTALGPAGVRLMTPDYASPEQVRGEPVTAATDIYSLAAVLYELLTGRRVHDGQNDRGGTVTEICTPEPKKPSMIAKDIDRDLDNIVLKALRQEPERRYGSVEELSRDLERFLQDLPVQARNETLLYRGRKFLKRNRVASWTAATSAVLALALVSGWVRLSSLNTDADNSPRSIAVLPLANLSGNPEQEYFTDGMTDALISDLARIRALRVISRTSTMSYKGVRQPLPEIARRLGVRAIAEGSVFRAGNRVRITVRLVDAKKERPIWSGSYEGDLGDVLALQGQTAKAIAEEIHVTLTVPKHASPSRERHLNTDAYDAYLKGRHALFRATVEDVQRSIQFFEEALEINPRYALAYAGLADSYLSLSGMYMTPREAMSKAKAAATRALEIDPSLAEAHISMGVVRGWYEFGWEQAASELQRAIELRPNDASAHLWYGWVLASTGRSREGITQAQLAHELDPLSLFIETGLGQMYSLSGRYELALRQLRSVVEADPNFVHGHMFLGVAYLYTKQYPEAARELQQAMQLDPREPQSIAYLAYAHAKLGDRRAAIRDLRKITELSRSRYVSGYLFGIVSMGMHTNDAIEWLQKAYEDRDDMLSWLSLDGIFDQLRADPRFKLLMRQIGLVQVVPQPPQTN
jgi:serine/threonine protein kinase/Tfp pilus assembly protein PilF